MFSQLALRWARGALCGAALLGAAGLASAQLLPPAPVPLLEPLPTDAPAAAPSAPVAADSAEDLKARIERLERQNEELMKLLRSMPTVPATPVSGGGKDGPKEGPGKGDPLGEEDVQKIVQDYIKSREAAAKKDDASKKADQERMGYTVGANLGMGLKWNHGVWAETPDKAFKLHVGGRTQFDTVWYTADQNFQNGPGGIGRIRDGFSFRRGRFTMDGTLFEVIDFWCEWDFINTANADPLLPAGPGNVINTPVPTDLWVQINHLPVLGVFRIGNMKPPISFEHLTSSRFLNFLERSYAFDAFIGGLDNGFKPGFMFFNKTEDERATWALGAFKNNQTIFGWNTGAGEYDVTGRVTWLPYYEEDGRCLVHLGLGASHRDLDEGAFRYRARTLLRNGPAALHTPLLNTLLLGDSQTLVVPEFAMVMGPLTVQAEYFGVWHEGTRTAAAGPNLGTSYFQSAYVEALWFLTGEHRPYNKFGGSGAAFTRVVPLRNYFMVEGEEGHRIFSPGAWQVGARYSWIDLNDGAINGGNAHDVTLGLNWFLNPNIKFQWNYSLGWRDGVVLGPGLPGAPPQDGTVHGLGFRMAIDW